jgi:ABC-type transport system involved in cytochrome c biogenesis permease component
MDNPRRQAVLTAAAMVLIAVFVLFVLPPAANDSEKAFRLVIACAALFAGFLKWRRAMRMRRDDGDQP